MAVFANQTPIQTVVRAIHARVAHIPAGVVGIVAADHQQAVVENAEIRFGDGEEVALPLVPGHALVLRPPNVAGAVAEHAPVNIFLRTDVFNIRRARPAADDKNLILVFNDAVAGFLELGRQCYVCAPVKVVNRRRPDNVVVHRRPVNHLIVIRPAGGDRRARHQRRKVSQIAHAVDIFGLAHGDDRRPVAAAADEHQHSFGLRADDAPFVNRRHRPRPRQIGKVVKLQRNGVDEVGGLDGLFKKSPKES